MCHSGSNESLRSVRLWLEICYSSHAALGSFLTRSTTFVPLSVVDVCFGHDLIETHGKDYSAWACFRYCWGGEQALKTTQGTLQGRIQGIHLTTFRKHFRMLLFYQTNRVCVIYGSILSASSKMTHKIWLLRLPKCHRSIGMLTISASSASSSHTGFLQPRAEKDGIELRYNSQPSFTGTMVVSE